MSNMFLKAREWYVSYLETTPELTGSRLSNPDVTLRSNARKSASSLIEQIDDSKKFILDGQASTMLSQLLQDIGGGMREMFKEVPLPFQKLWLEIEKQDDQQRQAALIEEKLGNITVWVFSEFGDEVPFAPYIWTFNGVNAVSLRTPNFLEQTFDLPVERQSELQAVAEASKNISMHFLGYAKAMTVLLLNKGMFEEEPIILDPPRRAERRRAEREGRTLPDLRVSKLVLGEFGRGHLQASHEPRDGTHTKKRAHWVRGHFMRNRAGGVSWRMPHIRGAGALIEQERHVTARKADPS